MFLPPVVLVAGLLDQASLLAARPYGKTIETFRADARFVRGIEATLPPAAMVFQLPYRSFPETPPQHRLRDYDPLRPYLHARTLRWSYPTMRGRRDDLWATAVVARPLAEMVQTLSDAGFAGILVDRAGYPDDAAGMEAALTTLLQVRPTVSDHARFAFFPMTGYNARSGAGRSAAEREQRRTRALHPLLLRWGSGCYGLEAPADRPSFRWCQRTGELQIINGASTPRPATLSMTLVPASTPARWTVTGVLLGDELTLTAAGTPYTRRILVPPGTHTLRMTATNPPVDAPGDPRTMVWRAESVTLREEGAGKEEGAGRR
jgi:phosphoglycerol transferase